MNSLPDSDAATTGRYLKATLATLARHDWRDPAVVQRMAKVSVDRYASLVLVAEADADRKAGAMRAYADLLLSALARLREPGFDLPRFFDREFDGCYAGICAAEEAAAPVVDKGSPRAARGMRSSRFLLVLAGMAVAAVGFWTTSLHSFLREDVVVAPLPAAETRLAFARESEQPRNAEQVVNDFRFVLAENAMRPPLLVPTAEGLFAHAPSSLDLTVRGRRLFLAFGVRSGAWEGAAPTDGACFSVKTVAALTLFERCIDPAANAQERRVQVAFVSIPAGEQRLKLETTCKGHCASDWTFWKFIRME